jgi:hypothetical protein
MMQAGISHLTRWQPTITLERDVLADLADLPVREPVRELYDSNIDALWMQFQQIKDLPEACKDRHE